MPAGLALQSNMVANIEALTNTWNRKLELLTKGQYELLSGYLFEEEG